MIHVANSYKDTMNLPKTDFAMRANLPQNEPARLENWEQEQIYWRVLEKNKDNEPFVQSARLEIYRKSLKIVDAICANDKKLSGFIKIDREWAENTLFRYKRIKNNA